ncbi:MAG: ANTAR domain-containing protein [Nitriliruptor sp.]|nr:MAG: ANTAR domain-containing protein [Nitriliruptor sp.]
MTLTTPPRPTDEAPSIVRSGSSESPDVVGSLQTMMSILLDDASQADLLEHVLRLSAQAIGSCSAVSVTVVADDGNYATAAASHELASEIDALQYELYEGPCIDSLQSGDEHHITDLSLDERWPGFRERALHLGLRSAVTMPLVAGGTVVGALNLFADAIDGFSDQDIEVARSIASPAAATLANGRAYRQATRLVEQLEEAMTSRVIIEQAKGILVATRRCDPDQAFEMLRAVSQRSNRKLRDVAGDLVDHAASAGTTTTNGQPRTASSG